MTASARTPKVQLGARVPPDLRRAAVAAAESAGMSLNVWVERTLGAALAGRSSPGKDEGLVGVPQPSSPPAPRRAPAKQPAPGTSWAERMAAQAIKNEADRQKAAKRR